MSRKMSSSCSRASLSNFTLAGMCSSTTMKPGCGPDLCRVGHAVVQGVKVLAALRCQHELLADQVQHVLFGLGIGQIGVQEVVPQTLGSFLQILHPEGAYRLNDIVSDGSKWRIHPRFTFLKYKTRFRARSCENSRSDRPCNNRHLALWQALRTQFAALPGPANLGS